MTRVGEAAWLLELGTSARVLAAYDALLRDAEALLHDVVPGAATLLVVLRDDASADPARLAALARAAADRAVEGTPTRRHEIPVRYDGPDLGDVAARAGLAVDAVVERHARAAYRVAFVGFQPGFAYLDGLPPELHVPRRASPRPRVPAGSVALAGGWTGIYPLATPGGWSLIGTTDAVLFDPARREPALLQPGDGVRFVAR